MDRLILLVRRQARSHPASQILIIEKETKKKRRDGLAVRDPKSVAMERKIENLRKSFQVADKLLQIPLRGLEASLLVQRLPRQVQRVVVLEVCISHLSSWL
jgi:hypothetical protein